MVIGIILSLMLLALFLVSYILLEKWDKQQIVKKKAQSEPKEKTVSANIRGTKNV